MVRYVFVLLLSTSLGAFQNPHSFTLALGQLQSKEVAKQKLARAQRASLHWHLPLYSLAWHGLNDYHHLSQTTQVVQLLGYPLGRGFLFGGGYYFALKKHQALGFAAYGNRRLRVNWAGNHKVSFAQIAFYFAHRLPWEFFLSQEYSLTRRQIFIGLQIYFSLIGLRLSRSLSAYRAAINLFASSRVMFSSEVLLKKRGQEYSLSLTYRLKNSQVSQAKRKNHRFKPAKTWPKPKARRSRKRIVPTFQLMIRWGLGPRQALLIRKKKDVCAGNHRSRKILKKHNWRCYQKGARL